jgi:hypothetical protein
MLCFRTFIRPPLFEAQSYTIPNPWEWTAYIHLL